MTAFSRDWLALREPLDHRARNAAVLRAVSQRLGRAGAVTVTDLASGTGSTMRAFALAGIVVERWRLVDHDAALVGAVGMAADCQAIPVICDLSRDLDAALADAGDLVATSAFLDLVSQRWLDGFADAVAVRNLPVYAALSYDGRVAFAPSVVADDEVIAAVNAHQRRDKGLGEALGPHAADAACAAFRARGYQVTVGRSDWSASPSDKAFQTALIEGWTEAAREVGNVSLDTLDAWRLSRLDLVANARSRIDVGHIDMFAEPSR